MTHRSPGAGRAPLGTVDGIRWLLELRAGSEGRRRRKAQLLLESSVLVYLRGAARKAETELAAALAGRTALGRPLSSLPRLIVRTREPSRRAELGEAYAAAVAGCDDLFLARLDALQAAAQGVGFSDYPALIWNVWEIDGPAFVRDCEKVAGSLHQASYRDRLARAMVSAGLDPGPLGTAGAPFARDWQHARFVALGRVEGVVAGYPPPMLDRAPGEPSSPWLWEALPAVTGALRALGLAAPAFLRLRAAGPAEEAEDAAGRPGAGRGWCRWTPGSPAATVFVADEPGLLSLPQLLHEAGHAGEGASRDPALEREFAQLVDLAVSEAWGMLVQAAAYDPGWLGRILPAGQAARAAEFFAVTTAYSVRKLAALALLYARHFQAGSGPSRALREDYDALLLEATGLRHTPGVAFSDLEDLHRVVAYLRGFALAQAALDYLAGGRVGAGRDGSRRGDREADPGRLGQMARRGAEVSPAEFAAAVDGFLTLAPAAAHGLVRPGRLPAPAPLFPVEWQRRADEEKVWRLVTRDDGTPFRPKPLEAGLAAERLAAGRGGSLRTFYGFAYLDAEKAAPLERAVRALAEAAKEAEARAGPDEDLPYLYPAELDVYAASDEPSPERDRLRRLARARRTAWNAARTIGCPVRLRGGRGLTTPGEGWGLPPDRSLGAPIEWQDPLDATRAWEWDGETFFWSLSPLTASLFGEVGPAVWNHFIRRYGSTKFKAGHARVLGGRWYVFMEQPASRTRARLSALWTGPAVSFLLLTLGLRWRRFILPGSNRRQRRLAALDLGRLADADLAAEARRALAGYRRSWLEQFHVVYPLAYLKELAGRRLGRAESRLVPFLAGSDSAAGAMRRAVADLARAAAAAPRAREVLGGRSPAGPEEERLAVAYRRFLEDFGDYPFPFADLACPTFSESPQPVFEAVLGQGPAVDPVPAAGPSGPAPVPPFVAAMIRRHWRLWEDHNHHLDQKDLALVRRVLLAVGERLAAGGTLGRADDVFYLTLGELAALLRSNLSGAWPGLAERCRARRELQEEVSAVPPALTAGPRPRVHRFVPGVLRGHAASPGQFTGRARIARADRPPEDFRPGEVLVCVSASPAWALLLPRAGAVVSDSGGVVCHLATLAREHGVPAVLGTASATIAIPEGSRVTVDGSTGMVFVGPPGENGAGRGAGR